MDRTLPAQQIDEILEGAERSDVPAADLVRTAALIRETLLRGTVAARMGPAVVPEPHPAPRRRRRASLAATIAAAVLLAAGVAGALPGPVQHGLARGASIVGVDLPDDEPDGAPLVEGRRGDADGSTTRSGERDAAATDEGGSPGPAPTSDPASSRGATTPAGGGITDPGDPGAVNPGGATDPAHTDPGEPERHDPDAAKPDAGNQPNAANPDPGNHPNLGNTPPPGNPNLGNPNPGNAGNPNPGKSNPGNAGNPNPGNPNADNLNRGGPAR